MSDIALSPTVAIKLRGKESVKKIRNGSPKIQQVLRERCRQRMKEKRGQLFNRGRLGLEINSEDVQSTLTEILRKEFRNLATTDVGESVSVLSSIINEPLDPEEALALENEIMNDGGQWILEEYEKMSKDEIDSIALNEDQVGNTVICPLCQKCNLRQDSNCVTCGDCGFMLNTFQTLKEIGNIIGQYVNTHSENCTHSPGFALLPENNNSCLYIVCHSCFTLLPILLTS